jgi:pimeloyl-ACP methyl ester carboxylesterase
MEKSDPVDGFRLAYDRIGSGPPVVLLHGWPGDRTDFRALVPLLQGFAEVVVPDFRGFGESDKHDRPPAEAYSAGAQARSIVGLIEQLRLGRVVLAGYDVGSRAAQAVARARPDLVRALVISPPLPGAGSRTLSVEAQREFWYQPFHQLPLSEQLIDGRPDAVRAYLRHFWSHWSGPAFVLDETHLDHLVELYAPTGAFRASIGWYRAGAGTVAVSATERPPEPEDRIHTPTKVIWPTEDPLFPHAWADRLHEFFSEVEVRVLQGVGHFTPLEAPGSFADEIRAAIEPARRGG